MRSAQVAPHLRERHLMTGLYFLAARAGHIASFIYDDSVDGMLPLY